MKLHLCLCSKDITIETMQIMALYQTCQTIGITFRRAIIN